MTKLIVGDEASIKLAKAGEIPLEAVNGKTKIIRLDGCEEACEHFMTPVVDRSAFGDGSDGDVTISAPTTLTRDMYYNNLIWEPLCVKATKIDGKIIKEDVWSTLQGGEFVEVNP